MDVAIRGDRASALTLQLGPHSWLFAIARGFGVVDGAPSAPATLARLRAECDRRLRGERFRRAVERPQSAATAILGALSRVNGDLFSASSAHDDAVEAACSISAALLVRGRAYVMHAGGTAAYLAHDGDVTSLTGDDALEEAQHLVLSRALGASASLDVSVSSVAIEPGDVMILLGHRVRGDVDRRALIAHVEASGPEEHVLVIRFDADDGAVEHELAAESRFGFVPPLLAIVTLLSFLALTFGWAR